MRGNGMGREQAGLVVLALALVACFATGPAGTAHGQSARSRVGTCIFDHASLQTPRGSCRPRARAYPPSVRTRVERSIYDGSLTFGIPYSVLLSVARCESNLNPVASDGRHVGLFQFLPSTFRHAAGELKHQTGIKASSYWNALDATYVAGYLFVTGEARLWSCVPPLATPPTTG